MNILITGGAGFIGANFCHYIYNQKDYFVCLDDLTYAGNKENLSDLLTKTNFKFIKGNICNEKTINSIFKKYKFDIVINFAAQTHVDNSVIDPQIFIDTNITGVRILLDACKKYNVKKFHQVSTDEVYGELDNNDLAFTEESPLKPTNPYSVSKAAADMLVLSYYKIFNLPITISRCSNNYGIYQHQEKFIPKSINSMKKDKNICVHGDGQNIREWIHVLDHCEGIAKIIKNGKSGEIYNIGSGEEKTNIEVANLLLKTYLGTEGEVEFVENRLSNDKRYSLNYNKIANELGYKPKYKFEDSIKNIIYWYIKQ